MSDLPSREEAIVAFLDAATFDDPKVVAAMERTKGFISHEELLKRLGHKYRVTKRQLQEARWRPVHLVPVDRRKSKPQWPTAVIEGVEMQLAPCPRGACGFCAALGDTEGPTLTTGGIDD